MPTRTSLPKHPACLGTAGWPPTLTALKYEQVLILARRLPQERETMRSPRQAPARPNVSAGILAYRREKDGLEVLLVHPGGPFWCNRDDGAWSIPKGELGVM